MPPMTFKQPAYDVAPRGSRAAETAADAQSSSTNSSTNSGTVGSSTDGDTVGSSTDSNTGNNTPGKSGSDGGAGRSSTGGGIMGNTSRSETVSGEGSSGSNNGRVGEGEEASAVAEQGGSVRGVVIATVVSEAWIPMMKMFLARMTLVDDREEQEKHSQQQQQQQQQPQQEDYLGGAAVELPRADAHMPSMGPMPQMPRTGHGPRRAPGSLVSRLLVICYDHHSLEFCCSLRLHCFLDTQEDAPEGERDDFGGEQKKFMTPAFVHLVWRRLHIIRQIISLGYDVIFTDNDVIWLQNPLPYLLPISSDIVTACDHWSADLKEARANSGFYMARSNDRVLRFFDYWIASHTRFPGIKEQDAFMKVRPEADPYTRDTLHLSIQYLPTNRFGGFCEIGRHLGRLVTVHSNCCIGLEEKMKVLQQVLGDVDWFRQLPLVDREGVGQRGNEWTGRNCSLMKGRLVD
ncbi:unnamed protein product [Closterium sp. NIES-54]